MPAGSVGETPRDDADSLRFRARRVPVASEKPGHHRSAVVIIEERKLSPEQEHFGICLLTPLAGTVARARSHRRRAGRHRRGVRRAVACGVA